MKHEPKSLLPNKFTWVIVKSEGILSMNVGVSSDKKEDFAIKGRWPYAAEDLRVDPIKYIYPTNDINNFLNSEGINFICGLRGLGKTLILRAKRLKYTNLPDEERESFVFIPDNPKNELDALEHLYPSEDKWDILGKNITWTQIWGVSIGLSIISNFLRNSDEESKKQLLWNIKNITAVRGEKFETFNKFLSTLIDWTTETKSNPSQFVNQIINNINWSMFHSGLLSELNNNVFNISMESVRSGCVVFIDQVDKSWEDIMSDHVGDIYKLEKLQEIWYSCQIGLIRAVYSFITRNHHIRIYSAIRQEVLGKLAKNDDNFLRYKNKMLIINYEKEDLKQILIKTIQLLESPKNMVKPDLFKTNSIEAFLGVTQVKPLRINIEETENIFDYMYRHTIQRPRDIIYLGSNIADKHPSIRTSLCIQTLINKNAEENLSDDYLRDLEKLMKVNFKSAYSLINKSIFTISELMDICQDYNKIQNTTAVCDRDCNNCRQTHLFCSLYNVGLLGVIEKDFFDENKYIQKFLQPQNRELVVTKSILPNSEFERYLLHTVLSHIIEKKRKNEGKKFYFYDIIIGDGCGFDPNLFNERLKHKNRKTGTDTVPDPHLIRVISDIFSSVYQKEIKVGVSEANSKTLEFLRTKLHDLSTKSSQIYWLDVGCGNGRCLEVLDMVSNHNIKYHGIDNSHINLDEAEKRAQKYGITAKFSKIDAATMKFKPKYDIVSAVLFLHEVDPLKLPYVLICSKKHARYSERWRNACNIGFSRTI